MTPTLTPRQFIKWRLSIRQALKDATLPSHGEVIRKYTINWKLYKDYLEVRDNQQVTETLY
jgi:hypothetical protein